MLGSVIEYDATRRDDPSGGRRWAVGAVVLAAVAVSFVSARGCLGRGGGTDGPATAAEAPAATPPDAKDGAVPRKIAAADAPDRQIAVSQAALWAGNSLSRSQRERTLLVRLADAERQGKLAIAVDTIEQLRQIPSMADLDDKLARRLGELNIRRLFSGEPVPWIAETEVRRGQSVHRIAREHGTTVAAVRQLNGLSSAEEPSPGRRLRVLEFPRAAFVVHKQTRHADLTLNGKLFKRYYVSAGNKAAPGAYPITSVPQEGPRSRFAALGIRVSPPDMLELDMFLAPGSSLTVSEM